MDFTAFSFYLALFPAALSFYAFTGRLRLFLLIALSLAFYAFSQFIYLPLLILATGIIYFCGLKIASQEAERTKQFFLWLGIGAVLAMLIVFKSLGAFHGILLPLGISYYAFKLMSYLIEVYYDEEIVEKDFSFLLAYAAFFPQIVCGPIQRSYEFLPQLRHVISHKADPEQIKAGFRLILGGLMMKLLLGDYLARFITEIDKQPTYYNWGLVLLVTGIYTLQLYADFAGYTNIALGIGKIFGIDGPKNFNAPFAAANIQQMWQRWHMSLTSWLTDYLFTPLNMMLRNWGKIGLATAIAVNMILIGIWHGFFLNYLLYGICHAFFIIVTVFTRKWRDVLFGTSKILHFFRQAGGIVLTFCLMSFSQIFFYLGSWDQSLLHLKLLTGYVPAGTASILMGSQLAIHTFICTCITLYVGCGAPGFSPVRQKMDAYFPEWFQFGIALFLLSAFTRNDAAVNFFYQQF